ncbi:hypothetical protein Rleg2_1166 [Rhizobium leguminosarum bv. trifolii WSM2304]|uniref:Uncharacterized protein n=1 Tax=Rhizobium leguminosarum bv. trifolii (strain WSM2304) TaxID=395492 RepID=A0ABF7QKR9_RHILW|nr:hypothetical protein [Rhizobium leguminosarum]ACI54460.1 hypothetical protein Rleg2_1166 [Rhizobium leguminosarum bv. trifolii WSM2304]
MRKQVIRNALLLLTSTNQRRPAVRTTLVKPPLPHFLNEQFKGFRPSYQYNNGLHEPYFVKCVFWTQPGKWQGKWVGMYQCEISGGSQHWSERYFWGVVHGGFEEVDQHGVRGIRKRMLRV